MTEEYDVCQTCDGRGGKLSYDSDGDGAWAMTYTQLDACPDCMSANLCPGCMQPGTNVDAEAFVCGVCGWYYDEDRFAPSEDDYYTGEY